MKPKFSANGVEIYHGDCREVLRALPDESVHCVVTSPPYWGLRDYGCDGQIGLEDSPIKYISTMREVFAEVRRVLRSDGTLWLNMGDSYATGGGGGRGDSGDNGKFGGPTLDRVKREKPEGLKPKDLVGIPWMLAFALREDGWYLRQDIIWAKPNPMPESVTDRCTKAHEYLFLLSKSERYYYNQEAVREPWTCDRDDMREKGVRTGTAYLEQGANGYSNSAKPHLPGNKTHKGLTAYENGQSEHRTKAGLVNYSEKLRADESLVANGRNKRSVWEVTTQPFPEAHFATFPEDLIKPCILAGCVEGGTVLDPFMGSGTTGLVARKLHCKAIGIELNEEYIEIASRRLSQEVFNFAQ